MLPPLSPEFTHAGRYVMRLSGYHLTPRCLERSGERVAASGLARKLWLHANHPFC
jgi:hypothetical protein